MHIEIDPSSFEPVSDSVPTLEAHADINSGNLHGILTEDGEEAAMNMLRDLKIQRCDPLHMQPLYTIHWHCVVASLYHNYMT